MTRILTWNIQNGRGVDGVVSLARIATVCRAMGDADILCLQEISRGLDLGAGPSDQVAELCELFPGYEGIFGAAVDARDPVDGAAWQFGNLLLARLPVLSIRNHPLPRPCRAPGRHMSRAATEVVVAAASGPLRLVNLHLEYHSADQRLVQVERLRDLQRESIQQADHPPAADPVGPYRAVPNPVDAVFCGDFNMVHGGSEYRRMLEPLIGGESFVDAWEHAYPGVEQAPTCGVHDRIQWPEGPHCRDFFFVTPSLSSRISDVRVDVITNASDHQPLLLELSDDG